MKGFDVELFEAQAKKQHGEEAIKALDSMPKFGAPGTYIPTSSESLNLAIGIGGVPRGRIIEIYGPNSGGKTTLALDIAANAQALDKKAFVFYQDSENALNPPYAKRLGVNTDKNHFRISQTNEIEESMNLVLTAAKFGAAVIVVDSVASLQFEKDLDGEEATGERAGGIAKPLRAALKKLAKVCAETGTLAVFINHVTFKVGGYGNPETTPGGTGLGFFSSLRLDVRPLSITSGGPLVDKKSGEVMGWRTQVKVAKNKVGTPFGKAEYNLIYGEGIDRLDDLVTVATENGTIEKNGTWLKFGDVKQQGKAALIEAAKANPKLEADIRAAFYQRLKDASVTA